MTHALRSRRSAATAALAVAALLGGTGCAGSAGIPGLEDAPGLPAASATGGRSPDPDAYADTLVRLTNGVRADAGLPALAASDCARRAALDRAVALRGTGALAHAPMDAVLADCAPSTRAAENLSRAAAEPAAVVDAWLGSAGHRANLLDEGVAEIGVGCVPDGDAVLCSQIHLGP